MFPDPHLQRPVRRVLIIFTFLVALGWIPTKGEEPAPFRCPRATMAYDPANPSQSIGSFHEGTELRLAPWPADPGLRLAVCRDDGGREVRALCRATDLGLDSALPRKTASSSPGSPSESTEADGRVQSLEEVNVGLFGDGIMHKITFEADGKVKSNSVFAQAPGRLINCDGMHRDSADNLYVADSAQNAIQVIHPDGTVATLVENGDVADKRTGQLDQPCEALVRGKDIIVSNMDWPFPKFKNTKYQLPATISVIRLAK